MVASTYEQAITQVFKDEGGYTNEAADPGGPTNWGITIHDARTYWKPDATAEDVKDMPKSIAENIYRDHYAKPLSYDSLPAGVDYAVLDYGINSGISKSIHTLQHILGVTEDGLVGPATISAAVNADPVHIINAIYAERLAFLKTLHNWSTYQHGWTKRCVDGRTLALQLAQHYGSNEPQQQNKGNKMNFIQIANLVLQILPTLFQAIGTIEKDTGKPWDQVAVDVINHLTPGQPNSASLSETANPSDMPLNSK